MTVKSWAQRTSVGLIAIPAVIVGLSHQLTTARTAAPRSNRPVDVSEWKLPPADRAAFESLGKVLVDAINAPTADDRHRLIRETYDADEIAKIGIERIAGQLDRLGRTYSGLALERTELAEFNMGGRVSRVLHVYARKPGDVMWRDLQMYVSENRPYRLTRLAFVAEVSQPITVPNGKITDSSTLAWLNEYVDRLARDYDLSGAVLIAVGDRTIFERYFGYTDAARSTPVTPDTLFSLASASKMLTALCIACLVTDEKLSYGDSLDKFFPEFPDQEFARRITIAQLLSHSSGVAEYWTEQNAAAVRTTGSTADMLPLVFSAGKSFELGTKHAYSNSNFILAGLIVERVSKRPYYDFVEEKILKPLGMTNTGYFESADSSRPIAEALGSDAKGWKSHDRGRRGTAAGGCFSTARDLLRFMRGLTSGKIVSTSVLGDMIASKVRNSIEADSDYGFGFLLQRDGQVSSFGHGGIARGMNSEIRYFPSLDITLIVLNSQDNGAYDDLRKNTTRLITGVR